MVDSKNIGFDSNSNIDFVISALTEKNPFIQTPNVVDWMKKRNDEVEVSVERVAFSELKNWQFKNNRYSLSHNSGKFFSIDGIRVKTNHGLIGSWDQPIINQPEIGFLGIICKKFDGILYFLLQAKIEPGNVNNVQLSPTLQATKSNYSQTHGGKKPKYLEYFLNNEKSFVLLDQLQSEQGARFLKKRNRNIIIEVTDEIEIPENFIWLTLGQIKKLISYDNLVNMDTRTVISGIQLTPTNKQLIINSVEIQQNSLLDSFISNGKSLHSFDSLIGWITKLKCKYEIDIESISLNKLNEWTILNDQISRFDQKYFKVIAAKISINNREVTSWHQPLIQPSQEGLIAFIVKEINGILHFLIQAKLECGNFDIIELAPTVQCLTGDYRYPAYDIPFINDILKARPNQIIFDTMLSEEGGRFYKEQNRNMIVEVDEKFPINVPDNYIWMTLNQLSTFIKFNNYINIQARSLISSISFIKINAPI